MAGGFFAVQAAGDGGGNGLCSGSGCGAFFEAAAVHLGEEAAQYGMAEQLDSLVGMAAVLAEGITDNLSGIGGGGVGSGLLGALPAEIAGDEGGHGTEGAGFAAAGFPLGDVLFGLCPALQGVLYAGFIVVGYGDFEIFVCLIAGGNVFPDLPADVGLYAAADVGGGFGHDLLPLQYGFEIGQRFGLSMGGGGVTVDADFLGGGSASTADKLAVTVVLPMPPLVETTVKITMANILLYQKHIRLRTVKTYRTASIELTENEVSAGS